jgi:hypothetical protein
MKRRDFLRIAGGALAAGAAGASPARASTTPETHVARLFGTLSEAQRREVAFPWDHRDPRRPDHLPVSLGDYEVHEVFRALEPALKANRALVERPGHSTHRRREVLRGKCLYHLGNADARRLERLRAKLDRHLPLHLSH